MWRSLIPYEDKVDVITPINILFTGDGKFWSLMKIKLMLIPQSKYCSRISSRPPRVRGVRGGRAKRTGELIRSWQRDFDLFSNWLYKETQGFWLSYLWYETVDPELIWTIRVFRALRQYCTADQIFVHFANTFRPYRNWVFSHSYRWRDGVARAQQTAHSIEFLTQIDPLGTIITSTEDLKG